MTDQYPPRGYPPIQPPPLSKRATAWLRRVESTLPRTGDGHLPTQLVDDLNRAFQHDPFDDRAAESDRRALARAAEHLASLRHPRGDIGRHLPAGLRVLDTGLTRLAIERDLAGLNASNLTPATSPGRPNRSTSKACAAAESYVEALSEATRRSSETVFDDLLDCEPSDRFRHTAEQLINRDPSARHLDDRHLDAARQRVEHVLSEEFFPKMPMPTSQYDLHVTAGGAVWSAQRGVRGAILAAQAAAAGTDPAPLREPTRPTTQHSTPRVPRPARHSDRRSGRAGPDAEQ